jgi:hypothetical protein
MKSRLPTTEEQIVGVLTGLWPSETRGFAADPGALLSIKRSEIFDYLNNHPREAKEYLKRWKDVRPLVDIHAIWPDGNGYKVAWMTRDGKQSVAQGFENINEAVVEHVCRHNGIRD